MTAYNGPTSKAGIQKNLTVRREGGEANVMLGDEKIGRIVSFGKRGTGFHPGKLHTVYASRIYWNGFRIEVEGASTVSVIGKVAEELSRRLKEKAQANDTPEPNGPKP